MSLVPSGFKSALPLSRDERGGNNHRIGNDKKAAVPTQSVLVIHDRNDAPQRWQFKRFSKKSLFWEILLKLVECQLFGLWLIKDDDDDVIRQVWSRQEELELAGAKLSLNAVKQQLEFNCSQARKESLGGCQDSRLPSQCFYLYWLNLRQDTWKSLCGIMLTRVPPHRDSIHLKCSPLQRSVDRHIISLDCYKLSVHRYISGENAVKICFNNF